ncbi:squalene-associated FAD-dependent desaturase [Neisseria sp. HSC-16F19]|nr:hydroxysqualene dehydroxylase HpnE [Neisseria sp. HSC-16F19]MCP2041760.1 squalene-associated FAD-dependent desaturase [Neisseria sp. HSC-16F19]
MTRPTVAVIGGGWAGLAAAAALAESADVTLFEAGKVLGGRARSVSPADSGFDFLDNGQHLLVGAYHRILALLQRAGVAENDAFLRLPLTWYLADGIRFQAARLKAPWHLLAGIARGEHMGWRDKLDLLRQMQALQRWHRKAEADISVAEWLAAHKVDARWQQQFWQPLVWGALNTPLAQASTWRLGNVLADGVWRQREDSDMLIARRDLGESWVEPVAGLLRYLGVDIRCGHRVQQLHSGEHGVLVDGEVFHRVIVALAPYHVAALLPQAAAFNSLVYHAITTVYLRYAQPLPLPQPLVGFATGTAQWLIGRGALGGDAREVAAVISLSDQLPPYTSAQWAEAVHRDIQRLFPALPPPLAARTITEKRATVACTPGYTPPPQDALAAQHVYLAGDYLHPRYPATLEAAVQSGESAATLCLRSF